MRMVLLVLLPAGPLGLAVTLFVKLVFVHESVRLRLFPLFRPLYKRVNPAASAPSKADARAGGGSPCRTPHWHEVRRAHRGTAHSG
jgi:hypothetical protein